MSESLGILHDGIVTFLPHHLNRQPVVVRGLTADELWICAGISAMAGLVLGTFLAWLTSKLAMVPTLIMASIAVGILAGGGALRRQKRGRPDTWLYRQLHWWMARHHPRLASQFCGESLVTRSGYWTTRRRQRAL